MNEFRTALDAYNLIDIKGSGHPFTWYNKQSEGASVEEILDRFCASLEWFRLHPLLNVSHLHATSSDHAPILSNFVPRNSGKMVDKKWGHM